MFRFCVTARTVRGVALALMPVVLLLAGCAMQQQSDAEKKADKAAAEEAAKETGTIDDARCQSFGFQPGAAGYTRCRKDLESERKQTGVQ
jgi:outer membrane biogenesis lipoprotein LolB